MHQVLKRARLRDFWIYFTFECNFLNDDLLNSISNCGFPPNSFQIMLARAIDPLFSRHYFEEMIGSRVNLMVELAKPATQSIESLLSSFMEILANPETNRCYGKDLMKLLNFSTENDFLTALHFIITNPALISFRSEALNSLSKTIQNFDESQIESVRQFFENAETETIYPFLLFTTTNFSELKSLSIINSILFDNFENIQTILLENNFTDFLLISKPEQVSPLFVSFSKFITPNMRFLSENNYLEIFLNKLFSGISAHNIELTSDSIESLLYLVDKGVTFEIPNIEYVATQLVYILHSEDEKCIFLALKLMISFDLPPVGDFSIIYTFIKSTNIKLSVESIKFMQHFHSLFLENEKAKMTLLNVLEFNSYRISFQSAMTLILLNLNVNEKTLLLRKLLIFLDLGSDQESLMEELAILLSNATGEERKVLDQILIDDLHILENLSWCDNEKISELAAKIVLLIIPE